MSKERDKHGLGVLLLEPYFGGSHRSFLTGLIENTPFEYTLMEMPARKWKWRMRLSAPAMAEEIRKQGRKYDRLLCSTFVDVAALRALGPSWLNEVPVLTYFHENQFDYPVQVEDERDIHFALTNMTTALASDSMAFNSRYNLDTFIQGVRDISRRAPDMELEGAGEIILERSRVLSPGLVFSHIDSAPGPENTDVPDAPVVLWNHRWEHDKGPEEFFNALYELDAEGHDFSVVVLGEQFERQPAIFKEARGKLAGRVLQFGYAHDRSEYARLMKLCTVAVSASTHEFFGISAIESTRAGVRPLLPRRLAYPGLFPEEYLYSKGELIERLRQEIKNPRRLSRDVSVALTEPHSWDALRQAYTDWIAGAERRQ